jgi:site-specific DNA-cytosine methylase
MVKEITVLSLFDGMSCGQIALNRAGIKYKSYFASEIDKYAIKVTQHNYPDTIQIGDVTKVSFKEGTLYTENGNFEVGKIDLLIGGSPCQGFSFAGKQLNFDDPRSKLFFEYIRLLNEVKPKYFLLENVKMKKESKDVISEFVKERPLLIDSRVLSAQKRQRLYWTNIEDFHFPIQRDIFVKDILLDRNDERFELIIPTQKRIEYIQRKIDKGFLKKIFVTSETKKTECITATVYKRMQEFIFKDEHGLRFLTDIEMERLQTVPDNYTNYVSSSQRKKMLGNGWTVDVIVHIFKQMNFND